MKQCFVIILQFLAVVTGYIHVFSSIEGLGSHEFVSREKARWIAQSDLDSGKYDQISNNHLIIANVETVVDKNEDHEIVFIVRKKNMDDLSDILLSQVANPRHPNYTKYWKREELVEYSIDKSSIDFIEGYLNHLMKSKKVSSINHSKHKEYFFVKAPLNTWEELFNTDFYRLDLSANYGKELKIVRSPHYSVPNFLHAHVDHILNIIDLPMKMSSTKIHDEEIEEINRDHLRKEMKVTGSFFDGTVFPQFLDYIYSIDNNTGSRNVSQVIFAANGQTLDTVDLTRFQDEYNLPRQSAIVINGFASSTGCAANSDNCMEANLDTQYINAIAQRVPTLFWHDSLASDPFVQWLSDVSNFSPTPDVLSISYGLRERLVSNSYIRAFNEEAIWLSMQGVTIVAASGDDGAVSNIVQRNPQLCSYQPIFPTSSPYVLSAGATQGPEKNSEEVACMSNTRDVILITTGGGFSSVMKRPAYQENAVNVYLSSSEGKSAVSGYSGSGRGYPDLSVLGHNYQVMINRKLVSVDGTSASAPVIAAMISLINSVRVRQGNGTVGLINPALYEYAQYFVRDITRGNNRCSALFVESNRYSSTCCSEGFTARAGWDPVTGLGAVNFHNFLITMTVQNISEYTHLLEDDAYLNKDYHSLRQQRISIIVFTILLAVMFAGLIHWVIQEYQQKKESGVVEEQLRALDSIEAPSGVEMTASPRIETLTVSAPASSPTVAVSSGLISGDELDEETKRQIELIDQITAASSNNQPPASNPTTTTATASSASNTLPARTIARPRSFAGSNNYQSLVDDNSPVAATSNKAKSIEQTAAVEEVHLFDFFPESAKLSAENSNGANIEQSQSNDVFSMNNPQRES